MKEEKKYLIVAPFPYDLSKKNFQEVYLGDPLRGLLGRGMMAVATALEREADVIAFGGGVLVNGEHESWLEQKMLLESLEHFQEFLPDKAVEIFNFVSMCSLIDFDKENNNTEKVAKWLVAHALEILVNTSNKVEICIITDPGHLRPIWLVSQRLKNFRKEIKISAVLSDIPYTNEEMTIIEGPLNKIIGDQVGVLIAKNKHRAKDPTYMPGSLGQDL